MASHPSPKPSDRADYGRFALVIVVLVVVYFCYRILEPFLTALIWSATLATIFHPAYARIAKRLRRPALASGLACVLLTLLIVIPVLLLLLLLAGESVTAYGLLEAKLKSGVLGLGSLRNLNSYQWTIAKLHELGIPEPNLGELGVRTLKGVSGFLVARSAGILGGLTRFGLDFVIMLFSLYYFFLYGKDILLELRELSPLRPEYEQAIFQKFREIAMATFGGTLATALIQGTVGGLTFLCFGLPSPLLWGAVMSFLSLVPLVGTALVWGPVVTYYLVTGSIFRAILMVAIFAGLVGSVDNVVKPLLIRRGTEINALLIFLSVLGGVGVFGFLGFVLGPFFLTILFVVLHIYKVEFRRELRKEVAG
jgi:predicted PurR-regulated permease PerM